MPRQAEAAVAGEVAGAAGVPGLTLHPDDLLVPDPPAVRELVAWLQASNCHPNWKVRHCLSWRAPPIACHHFYVLFPSSPTSFPVSLT